MASKQWSEIRELAYSIWGQEGCPHGRDLDHWLQAEREVTLLTLYRNFQRTRRPLSYLYPIVQYDDSFLSRGRYNPFSMIAVMMAPSHLLSLRHNINRFGNELRSLTAWAKVFETATEAERISDLYEFTYPIASQCLSMPYSIKQMFIKSLAQISHQTNRFHISDWNEKALSEKPNFCDAQRLASRFQSWPALSAALAMLDDKVFRVGSDDYRNQANHGFPRRIEYGYTPIIHRDPKSKQATFVEQGQNGELQFINLPGRSYDLYDSPPIPVIDLIPLLVPQHQAATRCYQEYVELIKEQHKSWPTLPE
jgi:hypothetical protein